MWSGADYKRESQHVLIQEMKTGLVSYSDHILDQRSVPNGLQTRQTGMQFQAHRINCA